MDISFKAKFVVEIPKIQRKLMKIKKNFKNKKIFVATNLLESMIENNYPTRGEANDIYSSLEMGANGLVLAASIALLMSMFMPLAMTFISLTKLMFIAL